MWLNDSKNKEEKSVRTMIEDTNSQIPDIRDSRGERIYVGNVLAYFDSYGRYFEGTATWLRLEWTYGKWGSGKRITLHIEGKDDRGVPFRRRISFRNRPKRLLVIGR